MLTVETKMFRNGDVDEAAYAKFVAKTIKSNMRARDKANKRGDGIWFGFTDDQCREAARSYCAMYRHQFRVLIECKTREEWVR